MQLLLEILKSLLLVINSKELVLTHRKVNQLILVCKILNCDISNQLQIIKKSFPNDDVWFF